MPPSPKASHSREMSFTSNLSDWAQKGVQSFFATPRILLDLALRQNANMVQVLRQQWSDPHYSPAVILSEVAGEGMTNFLEAQKVLLNLSKQQNELLMTGVKQRIGERPASHAIVDGLRRSVQTFIHMQEEFLKILGKQAHIWAEAAKGGKPLPSRSHLEDLAREGLENFAQAQMQFLDVIAEETARATGGRHVAAKKIAKTEISKLAREATESFIEAQKSLVDVASKQMNTNLKAAEKTMKFLQPFPKALFSAKVQAAGDHKRPSKRTGRVKKQAEQGKRVVAAAAA